jgi:glutamyl-tRNA synthetase
MRQLPLDQKIDGVIPFLRKAGCLGESVDADMRAKIGKVVQACGDRLKIFSDILMYGVFFFRPPEYDVHAVAKRVRKEGFPALLREFAGLLQKVEPFEPDKLEATAKGFCEAKGIKIGDLNHALRVATTGVMVGPGMFDILAILGREETVRRIETALQLNV